MLSNQTKLCFCLALGGQNCLHTFYMISICASLNFDQTYIRKCMILATNPGTIWLNLNMNRTTVITSLHNFAGVFGRRQKTKRFWKPQNVQQQSLLRGFGCGHDKGRTSGTALRISNSGDFLFRQQWWTCIIVLCAHCQKQNVGKKIVCSLN